MSKVIRLPQVADRVGIAKSTVWKWIKTKGFPRPTRLSPRVSVWKMSEVDAWLDAQMKTA